ncbi:DMT family transporter [Roseovarius nanhaiticus]|uniref:DMT family transporter n=1 Tax=Roseovarius nanhaiticus TaxID=573024 RepID=UPI002491F7EF|nr:DMT family transporter [Roseovarius nanhaiticus]
MKLLLAVAIAMLAFAANSVLNRAALIGGHSDPVAFGILRLMAGAAVLAPLIWWRGGSLRAVPGGSVRAVGVFALLIYVGCFSLAYLQLDAGLGALILFGCVQITMFGGAVLSREPVPALRWIGAAIAFGGLAWLLWPGVGTVVPVGAGAMMAAAGAAWGVYSLNGRGTGDPLAGTAANFVWAAGAAVVLGAAWSLWPGSYLRVDAHGAVLAIVSGAVTSGLGYALWYRILPQLAASSAGAAQLSVPILATAGGALLLGEALTPAFAIAASIVLGGVALSLIRR